MTMEAYKEVNGRRDLNMLIARPFANFFFITSLIKITNALFSALGKLSEIHLSSSLFIEVAAKLMNLPNQTYVNHGALGWCGNVISCDYY